MSRLRWPDSTNSVSEKPGTIQTAPFGTVCGTTTQRNRCIEKSYQSRWMEAFVGPRHTKGDPERSPLDSFSRSASHPMEARNCPVFPFQMRPGVEEGTRNRPERLPRRPPERSTLSSQAGPRCWSVLPQGQTSRRSLNRQGTAKRVCSVPVADHGDSDSPSRRTFPSPNQR